MSADSPLIDVQRLTKSYAEFKAVNDLSFQIDSGEVIGFLGPNGAGKTTTMRMLTTFLPPTSGTALIAGRDIVDDAAYIKRLIGYLPESPPLYDEMTVASYLKFVAELKGVESSRIRERIDWASEACGLQDRQKQVIGTLSKGFRQRVGIAQAILHDPRVLILDEPTSGLDPAQIMEIRQLIDSLGSDRTIVLSTHIMQEVTSVCNRVLILHQGKLVYDAPVDGSQDRRYRVQLSQAGSRTEIQHPAIQSVSGLGSLRLEVELADGASIQDAVRVLLDQELKIVEFKPMAQDLEATFIALTSSDNSPVVAA